jgi:hypothetical protein
MFTDISFTKEYLDQCLKELAKEFRRLNGEVIPAEIVLVGGASILANYGFRETTYDMDAIIQASSAMKEAINHVGDRFGLPNGWLNTDFVRTKSFSPKLIEYSTYYKKFSNILTIRTVTSEYLIAMKLMSGRKYKNDLSDVIGVLREHEKRGNPISMERLKTAVLNLYGSFDALPKDSVEFIEGVMAADDLESMYQQYREEERESKTALPDFEKQYPVIMTEDNIADILKAAKAKKKQPDKEGS